MKLLSRYFLHRVILYNYHIKVNKLNYLNKVSVFWYLILPFSFEDSNSGRPSLLQKLLLLHFIAKIFALGCILLTDECTPIPCEEFLICEELKEYHSPKSKVSSYT